MYEQQNKIAELKTDSVTSIKIVQEDNAKTHNLLKNNQRNLQVKAKEKQLENENSIKMLTLKYENEVF